MKAAMFDERRFVRVSAGPDRMPEIRKADGMVGEVLKSSTMVLPVQYLVRVEGVVEAWFTSDELKELE